MAWTVQRATRSPPCPVSPMDHPADCAPVALATDLLREEHRRLAMTFARYADAAAPDAERERLARALAAEVAAHVATDRRRLYPLVRHEADELVQALVAQQTRIRAQVDALHAAADAAARDAAVDALAALVQAHAEDEERRLFPVIEGRLPNTLRRLGEELMAPEAPADPRDGRLVFAAPVLPPGGCLLR